MMINKTFLITAFILGALAVGLGAFGAHGLKKIATPDYVQTFETGVRYQFYHVFALALAGIMMQYTTSSMAYWAGLLFILGMVLFSGSLYMLTYFGISGNTSMRWIGAVTPIGGLSFMAGWVLLALSVLKIK
ncbi:DUF423 domain-containing protein [Haoranjiania flava]|uniref:DUF423 domain-containing protein n=1 Tax=Haoranjiania flava TaxID=1856322 RepID=A0AAE3IQ13_9BACT|nr:DUF423 domain-containing protein [Haoranjiania flava]MCU7695046.1 DUF423 domain-containing protein [Haoranjiania flava]